MLLLAEGLFRLDIVLSGDTLRTIVRNLSPGELELDGAPGTETVTNIASGDVERYQPGHSGVEFALGAGDDRVSVNVVIGTLRFAERGTIRVSAQAIVRQAPAG